MVVFISEEEIETLKERLAKKDDKLKNQASELNHLTNEVIPELKKQNKELKINLRRSAGFADPSASRRVRCRNNHPPSAHPSVL